MNRGIKFKIFLLFGGFVFLIGTAIGATIWTLKSQTKDGMVVNLAGRQGMFTQQITKDALALSLGAESARENLAKTVEAFDRTLSALLNGGKAPDGNNTVDLPKTANQAIIAQLTKVKSLWESFHKESKVMLDKNSELKDQTAAAKYIEENNLALLKEVATAADMFADEATHRVSTLMFIQVLFFCLTIAVAVGGWLILKNIIVNPVGKVVELASAVADGDLTAPSLNFRTKDEMGLLGESLNKMKENLNGMLEKVKTTSDHVAQAATQLATTSNQIVNGAEKQSRQTDQVATAMEETSATVVEIAKNSQNASESAKAAQETAVKGGDVVSKAIKGMMTVADTVKTSAGTVEALGKSSEQIGAIVAVINDIADQTNLLALNAAIEAARAGEQGRGFAVVADEVRKLAEKTTKATKEIADMIKTIQNETKGAMSSMHEGTKQVTEGVKLANEAGDALRHIVSSVEKVTDLIRQTATAADQQSVTAEEISNNVSGIATVAKETLEGVKQISTATEDLSKIADELQRIVGSFRLERKTGQAPTEDREREFTTAQAPARTPLHIITKTEKTTHKHKSSKAA